MGDWSVSMDTLTGSMVWKEYISTGLPLSSYITSWPVLLSYTILFLGLYWLVSSLWDYLQIFTMNTPPGPIPLPFLGNFSFVLMPGRCIQLLQYGKDSAEFKRPPTSDTRKQAFLSPHLLITDMAKLYGKIYSLFIGTRLSVILNDFDAVKDAMVNHSDVFSDRPTLPMIQNFTKMKGRIMGCCMTAGIALYFLEAVVVFTFC